ncbi:YigZ family protein [Campylobacter sp. TTU-622]|uniref:IMPACT family protein n=1 Tax=Campylobacter TaxID=194 RepID=UPI001905B18F|nr:MULTISPECIES: YigZ family protein [Campylobacter]MBK1964340.1 YigZ family protein [Campylobacter novaezeelandiae]MBK1972243.1 YigZ family protein [Campylobacter sp. TTU_617]MBK1972974.1 YigZ family protein [Campylobacter sp. TTU-622]MBK1992030.1 YigZ family protein [Campylobacter sp. 2018MI34]MBK1993316.1 YigZ family protein [Campylobacter novaezeelandiae]
MKTIDQIYQNKIEVKKSVFWAFLCPFADFKDLLERLKKEHLKAVHFVYAYRVLNEFNQIVEDKNDDKEPKGTSAMPALNVLRGNELINTAVIIVRYFGGIKLGTGGLVRAYSEAVNEVIKSAILKSYEIQKTIKISINLKTFSRFDYFLNKFAISSKKEFKEDIVLITLCLNEIQEQELKIFLKNFSFKDFQFL